MHHIHSRAIVSVAALGTALILLIATNIASFAKDQDKEGDDSIVEQGFAASPIPENKLNLFGKDRREVGLGSYLVNAAADCNGCHSFPRFLRPGGAVPGTNGNPTGNLTDQGSNPIYGDPYLDPPPQSLNDQLEANHNVKHFLAGGRCFGAFMARNLTPDKSHHPRGLTEEEFIKVMRMGVDISCNKPRPPVYDGQPDGVCNCPIHPVPT